MAIPISYASVTAMVRQVKGSMRPLYVPQSYVPGGKLQVDFGEMDIILRGELTAVYLFCARLCCSCHPLVLAYRRQNQDSFLDGLYRVFTELGGVRREVIFDNARVAVASGSGARATLQRRYELLRVHYGFVPVFCNPRQGHEKGLAGNLVRRIRSQVGSPRPRVDSIRAFDELLAARCTAYEERQLRGRPGTVAERCAADPAALQPLPQQPCDPARSLTAAVSAFSTVRFDTNQYSVPSEVIRRCGVREVALRVYPEFIRILCHGRVIAEHARLYGRHQASYCLKHYLPLLCERPGPCSMRRRWWRLSVRHSTGGCSRGSTVTVRSTPRWPRTQRNRPGPLQSVPCRRRWLQGRTLPARSRERDRGCIFMTPCTDPQPKEA